MLQKTLDECLYKMEMENAFKNITMKKAILEKGKWV